MIVQWSHAFDKVMLIVNVNYSLLYDTVTALMKKIYVNVTLI